MLTSPTRLMHKHSSLLFSASSMDLSANLTSFLKAAAGPLAAITQSTSFKVWVARNHRRVAQQTVIAKICKPFAKAVRFLKKRKKSGSN